MASLIAVPITKFVDSVPPANFEEIVIGFGALFPEFHLVLRKFFNVLVIFVLHELCDLYIDRFDLNTLCYLISCVLVFDIILFSHLVNSCPDIWSALMYPFC